MQTRKIKKSTTKVGNIFSTLLFCTLLGCETTKQNDSAITSLGYSQLDQNNPKDNKFFQALSKNLEKLGSLMTVSADKGELSLYREGKRGYPTNYLYTIKPSPNTKVSLEEIKQVTLNISNH